MDELEQLHDIKLPFWLPWMRWIYPRTILTISLIVVVLYLVLVGATANGIYHFDANTKVTTAIEHWFPFPAASAGSELIPLSRVRQQVAALMVYNLKNNQGLSRQATESVVVNQIVNRTLYRQALSNHAIIVSQTNVDYQLGLIAKSVGGQDKLTQFLNDQYGPTMTLAHFRDWIVADSLVEAAVQTQLLERATVSHILINVPATATADQVEAARQKALSIKAKITDTSMFSDIAKQYSDDVASRDLSGSLGTTTRGSVGNQYSEAFEQAIFSQPVGVVSDPIRSKFGWHLLLVTKREGSIDLSLDQYTAQLRQANHAKIFMKLN